MAEETFNNVNNLENDPSAFDALTLKSNFLDPATIEQNLAPKVEWRDNFVNPTNYIKDNSAGVSPNYPPSAVRTARTSGASTSGFGAMIAEGTAKLNNMTDYGSYAEPYAYDAGPKGTFRARYKAYGQETFNKVGFSPLIDNETWFNQNTTFGDDLSRWATHSAWPMLTKGFLDPIKSYQSIINGQGLFGADEASARDYEYYNAIGASTKGGLGGFTVNLLNSASYSMGILVEGAVEGALIGAAFGGGNVGASAVEGGTSFLRKISNLPKGIANTVRGTEKLLSSVKEYSNLTKAKELFGTASKNFGNFINPLDNTLTAYKNLSNTDNLTNLARSSVTAGALWHDMMAMNLAISEGKLEGGFTKYQTYDRLYNDFVADPKNGGKPPTLEQQEAMMRQASEGSFWNTLSNSALVFYSNKLVFPSITQASFLKGMPKFGFGKVVTNVGKEFQVVFQPGKSVAESAFIKQRISFANAIKSLAKPATYGKVGLNYFKANLVEGAQEMAQDVLQETFQNYYVNTFKNPDARNFRYGAGLLGDALAKQWSTQGLETFLSGFMMGTVLQAPGVIKKYATVGYNDYLKSDGKYKDYIQSREQMADDVTNELNTLYKSGKFFFDPRVVNYTNQALIGKVIDNPDDHTTKEIKDAEYTAFQSAVIGSLKNGTYDMFLNHYKSYKQASAEDIEQAWNLAPGQGAKALERFDESLRNAEKIRERWNVAKSKMKFMANLDDYPVDSYNYRMAEIYNQAYSESLHNYVFLQGSFDDAAKRLNKLYGNLSKISTFKNSNFSDFSSLTDPGKLQREIEMLKTDIETLEQSGIPLAAEDINKKRKLLELYSNFQEKQLRIISAYIDKEKASALADRIAEENPDMTREELNLASLDNLIKAYEEGNTTEFDEYKQAFKDVLLGLANTEDERLQLEDEFNNIEGGFDGLFDELLDTHILKHEKNKLIPLINLLSNPNDFYEHLLRNFQWMKSMYHRKENIIKDIVNAEISAIERNTLLNSLADEGIYVDLEEFSKWIENPRYQPEFFIDVKNKAYIPQGSLLYSKYYSLFQKAADLESVKPAGEPVPDSKILENIIEEITEDRDRKIDLAKRKFDEALKDKYDATEVELRKKAEEAQQGSDQDIQLERNKLENYQELLANLENVTDIRRVATVIVQNEIIEDVQLYEAADAILANQELFPKILELRDKILNEDPAVTDPAEAVENASFYFALKPFLEDLVKEQQTIVDAYVAPDFIDVEKTEEWKMYQKELSDINAEYEEQIKDAKLEFVETGGNPTDIREYSVEDEFDSYPDDLKEQLNGSFTTFLTNVLKENASLRDDDFQKYTSLRSRWMENDPAAQEIINKYNNKNKEQAIKNATVGLTPPKLLFGNAVIDPATPLSNITDLYDSYEAAIITKELKDEKGNVIKLSLDDIKAIKEDMKAIATYIDTKEKSFKLKPLAQEVIERLENYIFNKQNELVLSVDEDGFETRRFRDSKPEDPRPERATEVASQIEQDLEEKDPFLFNRLKDNSIQNMFQEVVLSNEIGTLEDRIDAFLASLGTYKQFKSDLKLAGIKESLMADQSIDNLEKTIKKYSFKEASDSGINLDAMIRQFLTLDPRGGFVKVDYDSMIDVRGSLQKVSDMMSKEAYDFMFHPITGSATRFRRNMIDGGYQLFTNDVKVFDRKARGGRGVTGELDLLLIDNEGNLAIVDIKAAQQSTWTNLGAPFKLERKTGKEIKGEKNNSNKKTYFRAQQSIYGNSIYNMSGLEASLLLYPIEMELTMDGFIKKLSKPTADLSRYNQLSENGMFIVLEPLPEETMKLYGFERVAPTEEVVTVTEPEEVPIPAGSIPVSEPEKNTLNDFLDQDVIYQGKIGKLVTNIDGGFSVEVKEDGKITLYDINVSGKNLKDGRFNIIKAGLSPISATETVGQVTQIAGQTINARFLDKSEKTAEINGVNYTVNRDTTGAIVSLTYNTNDKSIADVQKQIEELNREISDLKKKQAQNESVGKKREIAIKTFEVKKLVSAKDELIKNNKKRTRRGGNADDLIFALNRLPNRFQKQVPSGEPTDRENQVKLIAQLSESESVTRDIDSILYEHGMSQDVENVIEGKIDNITEAKQKEIEDWGIELIIKLEQYQSRLANEGRSTVPVDNVIETVNEIINNLAALKFFKNGKITKASRKEFERRTKVQPRTNVPSIQKPAGTTTERVPGQTVSGEDLTKLIKDSRKKIQGINISSLEGGIDTKTDINDRVTRLPNGKYSVILNYGKLEQIDRGERTREEIIEEFGEDVGTSLINSAVTTNTVIPEIEALFKDATLDNIEDIFASAIVYYAFGSDINISEDIGEVISEIKEAKVKALQKDMTLDNLTEGSIIINKDNENFVVKSVNNEAKTVEAYSTKRKKSDTFTATEIQNNFMKPVEAETVVDEIAVTPQIKENIKSTESNITDLAKNPTELDKIEEESENLSPEERLNKIKNIFNQC